MAFGRSGLSRVLRRAAVGLALLVTASCAPFPTTCLLDPWLLTDLRLLEADEGMEQDIDPAQDLIAVYLRQNTDDLQIRLDFLEPGDFDQFDLHIAFDSLPGGSASLPIRSSAQSITSDLAWEGLLFIPAHGSISIINSAGEAIPSTSVLVWRDPLQQSMLISLDQSALSNKISGWDFSTPLQIQIFVTPAGGNSLVDQSAPVRLDALPPKPIQALLVFWNAYPAYTPATALRRWDGAHTGPLGGRHGLYNLLRTASSTQTPIVLLDLNQPAALSALDYAGGMEWVQSLQTEGLLALPHPQPDPANGPFKPADDIQILMAQVSNSFGPNRSEMVYLPAHANLPQSGNEVVFWQAISPGFEGLGVETYPQASQIDSTPFRWRGHLVIPIPSELSAAADQASLEGLTIEWKQRLLQSVFHSDMPAGVAQAHIVILGGDLPASTWGDPQSARATMRWLRQHPWVQLLKPSDLNRLRSAAAPSTLSPSEIWQTSPSRPKINDLALEIQAAPDNALRQAAWQAYQSLFASVFPESPKLPDLRANYVGQVWSLLDAAQWAAAPSPIASCELDPDRDSEKECVLASEKVYAQFEIGDGSLTYLFILFNGTRTGSPTSVHQLIGPSSQFITGLSDASRWMYPAGLNADPDVISGAFVGPGTGYLPELGAQMVMFSLPGINSRKVFHLTAAGLEADFTFDPETSDQAFSIPLALDAWQRFTPGWADKYRSLPGMQTWGWEIEGGPLIRIHSSAPLQGTDFKLSQDLLASPEDPNQDVSSGHYLPFPLALITIPGQQQLQVTIEAFFMP